MRWSLRSPARPAPLRINYGGRRSAGTSTAGYGRIQANAGSMTPAGVAIFGFRNQNGLVSEAGVPATTLLTSGRIYAEVSPDLVVNTGLAIANPNSQTATITFSFTNNLGPNPPSGTTTVPPNGLIAKFLDQSPFNSGTGIQGAFSFTSSVPISVVALRGFTNERGDFLMTTLPVIDTSAPPNLGTVTLPYFADGGGWTTQILLVNPGDTRLTGTVQFAALTGAPTNVTIGSQTNSTFAYSVAAQSSQKLVTSGTVPITGSIRILPAGADGPAPTPLVVFSFKRGAFTVTEAGVPAIDGTAFRMYAESSGESGKPGNIQTGIALANTASSAAVVTFELTDLNGNSAGIAPASINLLPAAVTAKFLTEIFPSIPQSFQGILRISSTSRIAITGLRGRYNEQSDFLITTTPPANESAAPSTADLFFPYIVDSGGYTTQFILLTGSAAQTSSGLLRLYDTSGQALNLTLR